MKNLSKFQKVMHISAIASFLIMMFSYGTYYFTEWGLFENLAITALTFFFHFAMRLFIGGAVSFITTIKKTDYNNWWFKEKAFEKKLYKVLKVKKWKNHMPTYLPETFSLEKNSLEDIILSTCGAELTHEWIILASFIPLLFSSKFGAFGVFLITSIFAAGVDAMFVLMQRYNRPRLIKLLKYEKR